MEPKRKGSWQATKGKAKEGDKKMKDKEEREERMADVGGAKYRQFTGLGFHGDIQGLGWPGKLRCMGLEILQG